MTQTRPHPAAMLSRSFGRGTRVPLSQYLPNFDAPFDWRRSLSLHRRLLAGDLSVMREVSENESDTLPSLVVMLIGVLAASLGAWLWVVIDTRGAMLGDQAMKVLVLGSVVSIFGWALWVALTWRALHSIFEVSVPITALMRSLAIVGGFAVWQFFMLAGPASFAVGLLVTIAGILLSVVAVRAAAPDADDRAAVISVGIGFGAYALALSLVADLTGVGSGVFVHALG